MKILAFILATIVLCISIAPCTDGIGPHDHDSHEIHDDFASSHHHSDHEHADHSHDHDHDQPEPDSDSCPPFCSCLCCGVSITVPDVSAYEIVQLTPSTQYSVNYSDYYDYSFSQGIWHPPTHS